MARDNKAIGLDLAHAEDLEIIWGNDQAPLNRKWMGCDRPGAWETTKLLVTRGPQALRLACPYTRTITVQHLLTESASDWDLRDALNGKTIFYGAGFQLTGDRVASPVFNELPGVYLHAMAYDNLVTLGHNYKRADRHSASAHLLNAALLLIAAWFLVRYPRQPPKPITSVADFQRRLIKAALAIPGFAIVFFGVLYQYGLDAAVWVVFAAYLFYRWRIGRDTGFLLLTLMAMVFSATGYFMLDIGPRNILAFFLFFEIVRHAQHHLKEAAHVYFEVEKNDSEQVSERFRRVAHWFFSLYHQPDHQPDQHTHDQPNHEYDYETGKARAQK
jgi:hypothetical protein